MKTIIWVVGVFLVCVGLVFLFGAKKSSFTPAISVNTVHPLDHVKGNASSTVVLVEYADFQCPACRSFYPVIREVVKTFEKDIAVVYRHFPLSSHANAEFASRASEAASKQGKFWEMHDLLFEKQADWENTSDVIAKFSEYAKLIGIDEVQFKKDFLSKEVRDFVRGQRDSGFSFGVQGTPTFFLNGKKIENPRSASEFGVLVNKELGR